MKYYLMDLERTVLAGVPCYWKKNSRGYTYIIMDAGEYEKETAETIVKHDNDHKTIMISKKTVASILEWELEQR